MGIQCITQCISQKIKNNHCHKNSTARIKKKPWCRLHILTSSHKKRPPFRTGRRHTYAYERKSRYQQNDLADMLTKKYKQLRNRIRKNIGKDNMIKAGSRIRSITHISLFSLCPYQCPCNAGIFRPCRKNQSNNNTPYTGSDHANRLS